MALENVSEARPSAPALNEGQQRQFPCKQCGASLVFAPGTNALQCPYCGTANEVPTSPETVEELDYETYVRDLPADDAQVHETLVIKCNTCAAETTLAPDVTAGVCPFCGGAIVATGASKRAIRPAALLPFKVTHNQAAERFRQWVNGLWFAPSALKVQAERAAIKGAYVPAWTYDSDTSSDYTGERGEDYTETESYSERDSDGQMVTRTREVTKTRWHSVRGHVRNEFDDLLVMASRTLPRKCLDNLEPWDLPELVPYEDEYLSGFVAESYQVGLADGFEVAKGIMDRTIRQTVIEDIGGDHQRIESLTTHYRNTTFKHLLLPVWISAYQFQEKPYRFLVNARTGEVQGERPYSWLKIALLVLTIIAVILTVILIAQRH